MKQLIFNLPTHFLALFKKTYSRVRYGFFLNKCGKKSYILFPSLINIPSTINIGNNTIINSNSWLFSCDNKATLTIGDNTQVGHYFHCVCMNQIDIGEEVLIADRVFISDCSHDYSDISTSVVKSKLTPLNNVKIGYGSWIGEGACINGCSIGRHCVIGSNSVVTSDIPDYSVAVGAPAKVVKRYDFSSKQWIKV